MLLLRSLPLLSTALHLLSPTSGVEKRNSNLLLLFYSSSPTDAKPLLQAGYPF